MAESPSTIEILIDYHFGTLAPAEAAQVEERLLGDAALLRAYLQLKRQLDAGATAQAPSAATRARLRQAVEAGYGPGAVRSLGRWLRRPVPLYQTMAVAAAVGAVVALFGLRPPSSPAVHPGARLPGAVFSAPAGVSGPAVDSARARPASLEVF